MSVFSIKSIRAVLGTNPSLQFTPFELPKGATGQQVDDAVSRALEARFGRKDTGNTFTTMQEDHGLSDTVDPEQEAQDYLDNLTWNFIIPGQHYSGLSNQKILQLFIDHDRDFTADTDEVRAYAKKKIIEKFKTREWDDDTAGEVAQEAIKEFIMDRIDEQGVDISLKPLTSDYAQRKAHEGSDPRIGIRRGKWFNTIIRKGYVRLKF